MPLDARRLEKLGAVLTTLTPVTAARLAQAVEHDRLRGGILPHEAILDALRPSLRHNELHGKRVPTAQRLVCMAFEDALIAGPRRRKQPGRILRSSIVPVWRWLAPRLGEEGAKVLDTITAKILEAGPDFARQPVKAFQDMAAASIVAAQEEAAVALGRDIAADALDMGRFWQIAADIKALQDFLPRPIDALEEDMIVEIRGVWEQVQTGAPDCAPYLVYAIMGRLAKPWEIMRLAGALSRRMDDILISRTDAGNVGELLLQDLEDCADDLTRLRPDLATADEVLGPVAAFGQISTGVVRELGIKRDGLWGKRLMAARTAMAAQMERLIGRAFRDIAATLPMARRTSFSLSARRIPDMTKKLEPMKASRALEMAAIISGARPHAMAGAFAGFLAEIDEKVSDLLRRYTEEMLDELRAVPEALRPQAAAYVAHATELTRLILGTEEAELIRRRAVAAVMAGGRHETAA